MEETGKRQCGESHCRSHHSISIGISDIESGHCSDGYKKSLYSYSCQQWTIQYRLLWIPGFLIQKSFSCGLHSYGYGGKGVGKQVYEQQMHRLKGNGQGKKRGVKHAEYAGRISGEKELYGVFYVGVNASSVDNGLYDGGKVVVGKYHRSGILGYLRSCYSHCYADIGLFKGGSVVYAVAGHRNDVAAPLPGVYDTNFMFWGNTGVDRYIREPVIQLGIAHLVELYAGYGLVAVLEYAELTGYGRGGYLVVSCYHYCLYAAPLSVGDSLYGFRAGRVDH